MRVLVTGGSGFIGSRLVAALDAGGHEVFSLDIEEKPDCPRGKAVSFLPASVVDSLATADAFELAKPNVVFHLAGLVAGPANRDPGKAFALQICGTANVCEEASKVGAKVILASSFYVYGEMERGDIVLTERNPAPALSIDAFGASKLAAEALVLSYARRRALQYVILRFGSVYGRGRCTSIVKDLVIAALEKRVFTVWGRGSRLTQPTLVDDIVAGCIASMRQNQATYNLASPERVTVAHIAALVKQAVNGLEVQFDEGHPDPPNGPALSSRKAIYELGWKPTSLAQGIEATVRAIVEEAHRASAADPAGSRG